MADPNPLDVEQLGQLVEAPMQAVAELHQVLDVVDDGEVDVDQCEEGGVVVGEALAGEELEQVAEVVAAVEGDPIDGVVEDDARGHEELAEARGVDAAVGVAGEVDAALAEELDGVVGEDVLVGVELAEVELPYALLVGGAAGGEIAVLVGECEP